MRKEKVKTALFISALIGIAVLVVLIIYSASAALGLGY